MTPEEQGCYDALREDNDCFKQENAALRSRLASAEKLAEAEAAVSEELETRLAEAERLLRLWERWDGMEDGVPAPHYDTHVWLQGTDSATHRKNERG